MCGGPIIFLRLVTAALPAAFVLVAGSAFGQPSEPASEIPAATPRDEQIDKIRERERTGIDPDVATGTIGTTGRGSASGAADSAPAKGGHGTGEDAMSEPSGPASAERRPGTATAQ